MAGNGKKRYLPRGCGARIRPLDNGRFQGQLALPGNRYAGIGTWDSDVEAIRETLAALDAAKAYSSVESYVERRRELESYTASVLASDQPRGARYTVRWWGDIWLEDYKVLRPDGLIENEGNWINVKGQLNNYIYPHLGDKLMTALTYDDCYLWLQKIKVTPRFDGKPGFVSAAMIHKVHKLLRQVLADGVKRRQIPGFDVSPLTTGLELPKVVKKQMKYPELDEFQLIMGVLDEWERDLAIWQCFSGLRMGETLGITYPDVRTDGVMIDKQLITGTANKIFKRTKEGQERVQPLPLPARQALQRQLQRWEDVGVRYDLLARVTDPAGLVWRSEEGRFLTQSSWRDIWHNARTKAGVPHCRPHDLRRSYGNYLLDRGVDIRVIQLLLGHADYRTTEIYLGNNRTRLRSALTVLDDLMPGQIESQANVIVGELVA